jgi:small subunit ribosomal protein S18
MDKPRRRKIPIRKMYEKCPFCLKGKDPDYKDFKDLVEFMTDRAKIMPQVRSGICSKHQRKLSIAVKRARFLSLLPFAERI